MVLFPDVGAIGKLLRIEWINMLYEEQDETWDEKFFSRILNSWNYILIFIKSHEKLFFYYWTLLQILLVGLVIIFAMYKSLKYVGWVKIRKNTNNDSPVNERIYSEELNIISLNDRNEEESLLKDSEPIRRSNFENTISGVNNYYNEDSTVSSITTVVVIKKRKNSNFLKYWINTIEPGNDGMISTSFQEAPKEEDNRVLKSEELLRRNLDIENCKRFYVDTTWVEVTMDNEESNVSARNPFPAFSSLHQAELLHHFVSGELKDANKNVINFYESVKQSSPKASISNRTNDKEKSTVQPMHEMSDSTLATPHDSSSVCYADEVLSGISDCGKNIFSSRCSSPDPVKQCQPSTELESEFRGNNLERVFGNLFQRLPELDLSPISSRPQMIDKIGSMNVTESKSQTSEKYRFRSLSDNSRTVPCTGNTEMHREENVSPLERNKSKEKCPKEMQSKIPTLTPASHRAMQLHENNYELQSDSANHIRSVLLRKLKELWEVNPRSKTPLSNKSRNSCFEDKSMYYTPEGISRIPLPLRSPHSSFVNDLTPSARVTKHSDSKSDETRQSSNGYSVMKTKCRFPENVSTVPLHSTPK